jgi:transcriptional regulator with XRE-family HTH domain
MTLIFIKVMLLKELLKSKGLKQKWLAEKTGVSVVAVSNWCTGKSLPNEKHLKKIAQLLDVSTDSLTI